MIEQAERLQESGNAPMHRYRLRAALIECLQERLHDAGTRERQLTLAITGEADLPSD